MPPTIKQRVETMEHIIEKHLEESGEIRTDLAWVKKSMDRIEKAVWGCMGALLIAGITALLKH